MTNQKNILDCIPRDTIGLSVNSGEEVGEWIERAAKTIKELQSAKAGSAGKLQTAISLIQEAKGFEGPNGGPITDHLDAAENWIDYVMQSLEGET